MNVEPFTIWQLWRLRQLDWRQRLTLAKNMIWFRHNAFWCWDGNILLGIAGFWELWDGVGEGWLILTPEGRERPFVTYREIRKRFYQAASELGLRRIQATVRADFEQGCQLVERLGLEVEGLLREYGADGADHWVYARILKCQD